MHVFFFLILAASSFDPSSAEEKVSSIPAHWHLPVCEFPSHDQLVERKGRDVCGPAVNQEGRPRSIGLLPTRCEQKGADMKTDADGLTDYCVSERADIISEGGK